ncbi:eukaryotic translation initiation factor 3 subunit 8 [Reticulomyxa filosa]|uniref:Eukaryotic translation initiation factor 3 subunit 8 n=1 Tax=Reticulomyxa filosa TaxID=46433 RepID=X6MF79_RETFI|nr:eukaryotic translation initiation factor 3 subunit 8 [Reticulomyxa filosa]|eukprot:ETO12544.1 eukaryotic translation initiation factor 3 subunit 8 [Reticulomyxa filosa]
MHPNLDRSSYSAIGLQKRRSSSPDPFHARLNASASSPVDGKQPQARKVAPESNKKGYLEHIPQNLHSRVTLAIESEVLRRVNEQTDKQFFFKINCICTVYLLNYIHLFLYFLLHQIFGNNPLARHKDNSANNDLQNNKKVWQLFGIQTVRDKYNLSQQKFRALRDKYVSLKQQALHQGLTLSNSNSLDSRSGRQLLKSVDLCAEDEDEEENEEEEEEEEDVKNKEQDKDKKKKKKKDKSKNGVGSKDKSLTSTLANGQSDPTLKGESSKSAVANWVDGNAETQATDLDSDWAAEKEDEKDKDKDNDHDTDNTNANVSASASANTSANTSANESEKEDINTKFIKRLKEKKQPRNSVNTNLFFFGIKKLIIINK